MSTERLRALLAMLDEQLAPRAPLDVNAEHTAQCMAKTTSVTVIHPEVQPE